MSVTLLLLYMLCALLELIFIQEHISHAVWPAHWTDTLPHFPTHASASLKRAEGARASLTGHEAGGPRLRIMCSPRAEKLG